MLHPRGGKAVCFAYFCKNLKKETMKSRVFVAGSLLLLAACTEAPRPETSLEGYWIEVMPVNRHITQGLRLDADGCAASIGMHTLRYTAWERQGEQLFLTGESLGNGRTVRFTDTLDIVRLSADSLTLGKHGMYRVAYVRADSDREARALLDSLRQPSRTDVLDISTYVDESPSDERAGVYEVTLYRYEHCGDGVFRLSTSSGAESGTEHFGRMYTLRGDASDADATVWQLRDFADSGVWNFRVRDDRLEPLDATLASVDSLFGQVLTLRR